MTTPEINMTENNESHQDEYVDPEVKYWSSVRAPLRGTLLGHYFASNQPRWLIAFSCYLLGYFFVAFIFYYVYSNLSDTQLAVSTLKNSAWMVTLSCALFAIGGYASDRLHIALAMSLAFFLFLFIHAV